MKKLLAAVAAAVAALALFGCANASQEKDTAPRAEAPTASQTALLRPAPQPIAEVTATEINACKNAWATAYANEHGISVAAAERYARHISTTPATTLTDINGGAYIFGANNVGATVWSTCAASIKAEREAQAQQAAALSPTPTTEAAARPTAESQPDATQAPASDWMATMIEVPLIVLLVGILVAFIIGGIVGLALSNNMQRRQKPTRGLGLGSPPLGG